MSPWTVGLVLFITVASIVRLVTAMHGVAAQELPPGPPDSAPIAVAAAPPPGNLDLTTVQKTTDLKVDDFSIHVPAGAHEPLRVLIALHGMGGNGDDEIAGLQDQTDALGWTVVAPTFNYGDWRDPAELRVEDPACAAKIAKVLDKLPDVLGRPVDRKVLLYGFSRGGQTANRFSLAYPERVAGTAISSSGTYTLPVASVGDGDSATALAFPYGVSDFQDVFGRSFDQAAFAAIPFWIGVGAQDVDPSDVPHQWDPYIGDQRVQRAQEFATWLRDGGSSVTIQVFPQTGHGETNQTRSAALRFLSAIGQS